MTGKAITAVTNMQVGWTANVQSKGTGDNVRDYDYLTLRLRWNKELHEEIGSPSFVMASIVPCAKGVRVCVVPTDRVRRGMSWAVKPCEVRGNYWYEVAPNMRRDQREDTKYLPGKADLTPANGFVVAGTLVCEAVTEPPVQVPVEAGDDAPPQPTDGAVLPFEGDASDSTGDNYLRPAWANVQLQKQSQAMYKDEVKHAQAHREQQADAFAADRRSSEEFRTQIIQLDTRNVQALESISTSLKVIATAVPPTTAQLAGIVECLKTIAGFDMWTGEPKDGDTHG